MCFSIFDVFVLIHLYLHHIYIYMYIFFYVHIYLHCTLKIDVCRVLNFQLPDLQAPSLAACRCVPDWKLDGKGTRLETWFLQIWEVGVYNSGHIQSLYTLL